MSRARQLLALAWLAGFRTGSALFNSLRQIGAAMGVALPAVAFELVAGGSRDLDATLNGSSAAFVLRFVVLTIPLILLMVVRRSSNPARSAALT